MRTLPSPLLLSLALGLTLAAPPAVRADDQDVVPSGNHVGIAPGNPMRVHFHVDYDAASGNVSGASIDFPSNPILGACRPVAQVCN